MLLNHLILGTEEWENKRKTRLAKLQREMEKLENTMAHDEAYVKRPVTTCSCTSTAGQGSRKGCLIILACSHFLFLNCCRFGAKSSHAKQAGRCLFAALLRFSRVRLF